MPPSDNMTKNAEFTPSCFKPIDERFQIGVDDRLDEGVGGGGRSPLISRSSGSTSETD